MYILFRNSLDVVVKTGTKRYNNAPRPTLVAVNRLDAITSLGFLSPIRDSRRELVAT